MLELIGVRVLACPIGAIGYLDGTETPVEGRILHIDPESTKIRLRLPGGGEVESYLDAEGTTFLDPLPHWERAPAALPVRHQGNAVVFVRKDGAFATEERAEGRGVVFRIYTDRRASEPVIQSYPATWGARVRDLYTFHRLVPVGTLRGSSREVLEKGTRRWSPFSRSGPRWPRGWYLRGRA